MSKQNYRAYMNLQSEFDHYFAAWAVNHCGWSKMKRRNRRIAKRRQRQVDRRLLWEVLADA